MPEHELRAEVFSAERQTWVRISEAARLVGRHRSTIEGWISAGRLAPEACSFIPNPRIRDPRGRQHWLRVVWLDAVRALVPGAGYVAPP